MRSWVEQQTGLQLGYVEQLYTFGDRFRTAHMEAGTPWIISGAYLALVRERDLVKTRDVQWRDWYGAFPWEDWRSGRPPLIETLPLAGSQPHPGPSGPSEPIPKSNVLQ